MKIDYNKIFEKSGKDEKIFGFKREREDSSIKFYLPNMIFDGIKNESIFKRLRSYIELLAKYKKEKIKDKNSLNKSKFNNKELQVENNLLSYLFLIEDYEKNPEFCLFKKINKNNDKKIDWKKTINKNDLFIINKKPIYNTFVSKSKIKDIENEFYQLYQDNLNNAFELFFGYKIFKDRKRRKSLNESIKENKYKKEISIIDKFLDSNFKDRDIQLAKRLKDIYKSRSESILSESKTFLFDNTVEINMVWEHMIERIIKGESKQKMIQVGKFELTQKGKKLKNKKTKKHSKVGLQIEPDHFKIIENRGFILDSKFYSLYNKMIEGISEKTEKDKCNECGDKKEEDFNSAAINKQETYKRIYKKKYPKLKSIHNVFVMPKIERDQVSENLNPIHFADHILFEDYESENDDYLIHCIALDFNEVANRYLKGEDYKDFEDLLTEIINDLEK